MHHFTANYLPDELRATRAPPSSLEPRVLARRAVCLEGFHVLISCQSDLDLALDAARCQKRVHVRVEHSRRANPATRNPDQLAKLTWKRGRKREGEQRGPI